LDRKNSPSWLSGSPLSEPFWNHSNWIDLLNLAAMIGQLYGEG